MQFYQFLLKLVISSNLTTLILCSSLTDSSEEEITNLKDGFDPTDSGSSVYDSSDDDGYGPRKKINILDFGLSLCTNQEGYIRNKSEITLTKKRLDMDRNRERLLSECEELFNKILKKFSQQTLSSKSFFFKTRNHIKNRRIVNDKLVYDVDVKKKIFRDAIKYYEVQVLAAEKQLKNLNKIAKFDEHLRRLVHKNDENHKFQKIPNVFTYRENHLKTYMLRLLKKKRLRPSVIIKLINVMEGYSIYNDLVNNGLELYDHEKCMSDLIFELTGRSITENPVVSTPESPKSKLLE